MIPDAEAKVGAVQATEHDPRVTRVGRLLRATAMDELPQLWNIFCGDMSFTGPRALRPGEIEVAGTGQRRESSKTCLDLRSARACGPDSPASRRSIAPRDITRRGSSVRPAVRAAAVILAGRSADPALVLDHLPGHVGDQRLEALMAKPRDVCMLRFGHSTRPRSAPHDKASSVAQAGLHSPRPWPSRDRAQHIFRPAAITPEPVGLFRSQGPAGGGSGTQQPTRSGVTLPMLLERYGITSLLDAPCGDFHWMIALVRLAQRGVYVGVGHRSRSRLERNETPLRHRSGPFSLRRHRRRSLPSADAVLCRDCFIHLPTRLIRAALANFRASGIRYLLLTNDRDVESYHDIRLAASAA